MLFRSLCLLAQLGLIARDVGGTPHFATLTWPAVTVTDSNDDGTTFIRPALGYYVWRAEVVKGVQGSWLLLNPDEVVRGMALEDGTAADADYLDSGTVEGTTYVYAVSAVDLGGESALSPVSNVIVTPVNPNAPSKVQASVN